MRTRAGSAPGRAVPACPQRAKRGSMPFLGTHPTPLHNPISTDDALSRSARAPGRHAMRSLRQSSESLEPIVRTSPARCSAGRARASSRTKIPIVATRVIPDCVHGARMSARGVACSRWVDLRSPSPARSLVEREARARAVRHSSQARDGATGSPSASWSGPWRFYASALPRGRCEASPRRALDHCVAASRHRRSMEPPL